MFVIVEATVIVIQIEEGKTFGGILQKENTTSATSPPLNFNNDGIVPSQRRPSIRRPSLLVSMEPSSMTSNERDQTEIKGKIESLDLNSESGVSTIENERRDSLSGVSFDPNSIYEPPGFALTHQDTDMPPPVTRDRLEIDEYPLHTISTAWIKMMTQGLSEWIKLPVIICRGSQDG